MSKDKHTASNNTLADVAAISAELAELRQRQAVLEERVKLARGTGDVTALAAAAVAQVTEPVPSAPEALSVRIEKSLRNAILDLKSLAKVVEASTSEVARELEAARLERKVFNVGSAASARWIWRVGDTGPTTELRETMIRLMTYLPITTAEMVAATGARLSRVSGALADIERSGACVVDLRYPNEVSARYFIMPKSARDARLPKKARR
jgi:hypothetical protein